MYRSTKGASKARRDQINAEIRNLKELLPITDTDKARLSYLHIMSLACMYTRKSLFFSQDDPHEQSRGCMSSHELTELLHELAGFMLVMTGDGKLLYLSENVVDHLGLSMVDLVAQSDSVYDIIDPTDHFILRNSLAPVATGDTDQLFRCRFNTSRFIRRQGSGKKVMLVRARCLSPPCPVSFYWTSNPVWVCFCTPLRANPTTYTIPGAPPPTPPPEHSFLLASFHSQHNRDMMLWDVQESVTVYLGHTVEGLCSRSWYSLLHPRDLSHASTQHCALLCEGGERQVEMVVQVEAADHSWVWLYMVLELGSGEHPISCNNYIISESEAWSLRQQLCLEQNPFTGYYGSGETLSSPDQVFTPSSSGLSAQSFDFTTATSGVSFPDEAMQSTGHHPRSSLSSLEEENLTQTHGQQQWYREAPVPAPISPSDSLTEPESDVLTQRIPSHLASLPEPLSSCLVKLCTPTTMPHPQQIGEFACTPPYSPQLSMGCFHFGESLHLCADSPNSVVPTRGTQSFSGANSTDDSVELLSAECYRKMTRSEGSFIEGECNIMSLPEIRGPLYVDVPQKTCHGSSNELLTPESSPIQQPCPFLFSTLKEQEKEREEISLLARYISSLAERFHCEPCLPEQTPFSHPPLPTPKPQTQKSFCEGECHPQSALDQSPHEKDMSLREENVLLEILYQDLSSCPSSPSSYSIASDSASNSSFPCSPQAPVIGYPPSNCGGEYSSGADHISSVQSTQYNCMAVGGAAMATGAVIMKDVEESPEDVMMDMFQPPQSSSVTVSQESASALALPTLSHSLPHAQFLMEDLVAMDEVFEADASISPAWGNNLSCINSHSTTMASRSFHQGGSLRDPTF